MSSAICFNLDQSKILSFGNGIDGAKMTILCFDRVEKTVAKGPFPAVFSKPFFFRVVKSPECVVKS